ncbi:glutaredoxin family protein [Candidatus Dependentiae bacterium]|nr:glutaredoxin family protein [Candidatus Dependentiae bacterium]
MKTHKVIVFTSPSCSWCRKVKDYLKKNKVRFTEIDIVKKPEAARDIQKKTGQIGVPVILINNRAVVGFNKDKIDRMLELKKH